MFQISLKNLNFKPNLTILHLKIFRDIKSLFDRGLRTFFTHKNLIPLLFCVFLEACSGSGKSRTRTSNNNENTKDVETCSVENGKVELREDQCKLISCNAGYDDHDEDDDCDLTIAEYYSPADSKERIACTKPTNASWTTATGLISEADCANRGWTCDGGYDTDGNSGTCEETDAEYYSPVGSNDRIACTKPANASWTTATGLISVADCAVRAWVCNEGYDTDGNSGTCEETDAEYYSPAGNSDRIACTKPTNASWTTATGLISVADCAVSRLGLQWRL